MHKNILEQICYKLHHINIILVTGIQKDPLWIIYTNLNNLKSKFTKEQTLTVHFWVLTMACLWFLSGPYGDHWVSQKQCLQRNKQPLKWAKIKDKGLLKACKVTGLTCYTASPNGEEGQLKATTGFICPGWQNKLISVLRKQDKHHNYVFNLRLF